MDSFDDKIKSLFEKDLPMVPTDFGWEDNKVEIFSKMEQEKTRRPWILWFFFGAGLLMSLLYYFANTGDIAKDSMVNTADQVQLQNPILKENLATEIIIENTASLVKTKTNAAPSNNKGRTSKVFDNIIHSTNHDQEFQGEIRNRSFLRDSVPKLTQSITRSRFQPTAASDDTGREPVGAPIHLQSTEMTNAQSSYRSFVSFEKPRNLITMSYLKNDPQSLAYDNLIDIKSPNKQVPLDVQLTLVEDVYRHSVFVGGGTLLSFGTYNGIDARNQYSRWLPGYHGTVGYTIGKGRLGMQLQYDHNFAVQLFDFEDQDLVLAQKDDVVTHVITNPYSMETTEMRGSISSNVTRNRDYKTYNTFRSHSLGLSLLYETIIHERSSIFVGLGGRYTYGRTSIGYNFDSDLEILSYDDQRMIYSSDNLEINTQVSMQYRMRKGFFLSPYVKWNKSLSNISLEENISLRKSQLHIGLGLGVRI